MSPVFSWILRISILGAACTFIYFYLETDVIFSIQGLYAVLFYFLLSVITGIRYKNIVYDTSGRFISNIDVFRIPAAMNLASYLIPVKGGGVWLFFYLKKCYGFSSTKSIFLASFNLLFLLYLVVLVVLAFYFDVKLGISEISIGLLGYFFVLALLRAALILVSGYKITWRFTFIDAALVILHFLVLSSLCYLLVGPVSIVLSFSLALFLLVSAFLKITPGNIGILEGAAILAAQAVPDYGDMFPALAASYRSLSILHAVVAGVPSMISLSLNRQSAGEPR